MGGMTPELPKIADEIYEAAARAWAANSMAAVHGDWSARDQWPARLQDNENLHRIVDTVWPVAYQAGREDAAREIEQPDSILCDCSGGDGSPANPRTLAPMDHHCDCAAVQAAATMLGALSKTNHGRQCIHGTEMDEFYEVNQQPRTPIRGVGDNTEEQQQRRES